MLINMLIETSVVEVSFADKTIQSIDFPSSLFGSDDENEILVLYFYPGDFTTICVTEVLAFHALQEEFAAAGASLVGCSINTAHVHNAWKLRPREQGGLGALINHPMIGDHSGELARKFDVLIPKRNVATRGLFMINREGRVLFESRHDTKTARNVKEILEIVRDLRKIYRNDKRERTDSL